MRCCQCIALWAWDLCPVATIAIKECNAGLPRLPSILQQSRKNNSEQTLTIRAVTANIWGLGPSSAAALGLRELAACLGIPNVGGWSLEQEASSACGISQVGRPSSAQGGILAKDEAGVRFLQCVCVAMRRSRP